MPVVTVSQLNNYIKRYLEQNHQLSDDLWIKGEVSNYKHHYSGHIYITLKDETSTLKAVMFKVNASRLKFELSDGMKVVALGRISVYEPSGQYQLYIDTMIPDGKGELYAAYEQLKLKLDEEGLFALEHKKPIPKFPKRVGVVSSVTGAALRDILNVLKRRYPIADVIIYPVMVQGIGASDSICKGLKYFSDSNNCDVVILSRGGGSIEDLWAFNEEITARAIFECNTPVITGVGHETDYTISDFVSDLRAPTPSAAAELSVPSLDELLMYIEKNSHKLQSLVNTKLQFYQERLNRHSGDSIYRHISDAIEKYRLITDRQFERCTSYINNKVIQCRASLGEVVASLEPLNPLSVIKRGYTVAEGDDGKLFDFNTANEGDKFKLIFDGGEAECLLRGIINENK